MKRAELDKKIDEYLRLPYTIIVRQYDDGTYFAEVEELEGCMTEADTAEEVMKMIKDAMAGWIELCLTDGHPVPGPRPPDNPAYSGNFVVRAPKALHRDLSRRALAEGTSLNQYVITALSRALGVHEGREQYRASAKTRSKKVKQA